ncbi:MAG: hypothetical protein IPG45_09240 [Deltaproteobacteria bacterium]|nr:hypothetical protein [Deltaproteobacteria bacterium]
MARPWPVPSNGLWPGLLILTAACGSDPPVEPPPPVVTFPVWELTDPCTAQLPTPNDAHYDPDGRSVLLACPAPADPIEAALASVTRSLRAPTDAQVRIPFSGTLDPASLSTSTAAAALPAAGLLHRIGTGTAATSFELVAVDLTLAGSTLEMTPVAPLAPGDLYLAFTTQTLKDQERPQKAPARSPIAALLVGSAPIAAAAVEGLDSAAAARLEALRLSLQPLVAALGSRYGIAADKLVTIHGFSVEVGAAGLERLVATHRSALAAGRFPPMATHRSVPLGEIYAGQPPVAYANVLEFHVGTIKVPKVLGADGRIRPTWLTDGQTIDLPFSFSIPKNAPSYPVAILLPGFGRGKLDGRGIANEFAGGPTTAVMTLELRCHGDRSQGTEGNCRDDRTPAEIDALPDTNNNGNPEFTSADGIPDGSGVGYFPSDGMALRDSQLAAIIEVLHVLWVLRQPNAISGFVINAARLHLIGMGHHGPVTVAAAALTDANARNLTVQLPSAGIGYRSLILDGPPAARAAFLAGLPGLNADQAGTYLDRLEDRALAMIDLHGLATVLAARLRNGNRLERALLAHPSAPDQVSIVARQALIDALGLPRERVSAHAGNCSGFFLYTCALGDNPTWRDEARRQMITFVDSGGVTVTPPGR